MSRFARDALAMIESAEHALSGDPCAMDKGRTTSLRSPTRGTDPSYSSGVWEKKKGSPSPGDSCGWDLSRQLHFALKELTSLRAEFAAEREARGESLVALGRRWKDELRVELRAGAVAQERALSALEAGLTARLQAEAGKFALLKRQQEELQHTLKAHQRGEFDRQEQLREEMEGLRGRIEQGVAAATALRGEVVREMENEKAALSTRLEVELRRGVDLHQEDLRQIQSLKASMAEEMRRAGSTIREMVQQTWGSFAAGLEREVRETQTGLVEELKRTGERVRAVEEKVEERLRTGQAELRVQTTMLRDRVAALESNEAVGASRMDRAEKKADAAHDSTSRMDAAVLVAREMVERAVGLSQRAAERAQRVEDVLLDRDARLIQVESQLHAVSTAGSLKATVVACERGLTQMESRVNALGEVCARGERLVEESGRKTDAILGRLSHCEKANTTLKSTLQGVMENVQGAVDRLVVVEDTRERIQGAADQQELACVRLEHRLDANENRTKLLAEKHAQFQKELLAQHHTLHERVEASFELISLSESVNKAAKADVERLEKRLIKIDSSTSGFLERCEAVQAEVEEFNNEIAALQRQSAQIKEKIDLHANRKDSNVESLERLEAEMLTKSKKLEKDVMMHLEQLTHHTEETAERLEAAFKDADRQHADAIKGQVREIVENTENQYDKLTEELLSVYQRLDDIEQGASVFREFLERDGDRYITQTELDPLSRLISTNQAQLRGLRGRTMCGLRETRRRIEIGEQKLKIHYAEVDRLKAALEGCQRELLAHKADGVRYEKLVCGMASPPHQVLNSTTHLVESTPTRQGAMGASPSSPAEGVGTSTKGNSTRDMNLIGGLVPDSSSISVHPAGVNFNYPFFPPTTTTAAALAGKASKALTPSPAVLVPEGMDPSLPTESIAGEKNLLCSSSRRNSLVSEGAFGVQLKNGIKDRDSPSPFTGAPSGTTSEGGDDLGVLPVVLTSEERSIHVRNGDEVERQREKADEELTGELSEESRAAAGPLSPPPASTSQQEQSYAHYDDWDDSDEDDVVETSEGSS
ncbi:unnamed protein product [Phytomonas sp. Hart1]|nr:unnamed protein product [Phytomonas sp. Hart1]|eukprot:CCW66658.1 unnamed protein product [Phytomonas sp. isolate Hart1]